MGWHWLEPPQGQIEDAIDWINKAGKNGAHVIAIDVPSGLDASQGRARGSSYRR